MISWARQAYNNAQPETRKIWQWHALEWHPAKQTGPSTFQRQEGRAHPCTPAAAALLQVLLAMSFLVTSYSSRCCGLLSTCGQKGRRQALL